MNDCGLLLRRGASVRLALENRGVLEVRRPIDTYARAIPEIRDHAVADEEEDDEGDVAHASPLAEVAREALVAHAVAEDVAHPVTRAVHRGGAGNVALHVGPLARALAHALRVAETVPVAGLLRRAEDVALMAVIVRVALTLTAIAGAVNARLLTAVIFCTGGRVAHTGFTCASHCFLFANSMS